MRPLPFRDRGEAGRRLAGRLAHLAAEDPLVLALPRGGVPVAAPVAAALRAELDVLVVRKLGAPGHPEYGLGAVAAGGEVLDEGAVRGLGVAEEELDRVRAGARGELARQEAEYRRGRPPPAMAGRTVLLVDDGLATGGTMRAAVQAARRGGARRVVVAVPVGPADTVESLRREADEVVTLETPFPFSAVGAWFADFAQVSDAEVREALARAWTGQGEPHAHEVTVPLDGGVLAGTLTLPSHPRGVVLFAHGSGSSRASPRNREVAASFQRSGLATLLLDLLTEEEARVDARTQEHRFDIPLLSRRVQAGVRWLAEEPRTRGLPIGLYGSSTGAAAALRAAAALPGEVGAVVGRGGRPDLAAGALARVRAPTRLIVGSRDVAVLALNREAAQELGGPASLEVVPGASHLFEEAGTLDEVERRAAGWFLQHLAGRSAA